MQPEEFKICRLIQKLINNLINDGIISPIDEIFCRNQILKLLNINSYSKPVSSSTEKMETPEVLSQICEYAIKLKIIESYQTAYLADEIMGLLTPWPSIVQFQFDDIRKSQGDEKAFSYFHDFCSKVNYVKKTLDQENKIWSFKTKYAPFIFTINVAKPEKSPLEIERSKLNPVSTYPLSVLSTDNVGFGNKNSNLSRNNLRYVDLKVAGKKWFLQYSPYSYFPEHFVLNDYKCTPMIINHGTIETIIDFVDQFPFYFLGSNADLSIVGGSILNHLHYQGGRVELPIESAKPYFEEDWEGCKIKFLDWPLATIEVSSTSKNSISKAAKTICDKWKSFSLIASLAEKNRFHNTSTLIGRKKDATYKLYIILRNNSTSNKYPGGIFHIAPDVWNLKKENIGLIEAGGMLILPGRLTHEIKGLVNAYNKNEPNLHDDINHHQEWYEKYIYNKKAGGGVKSFVVHTVSKTIVKGLENCHVFRFRKKEGFATFWDFVKGSYEEN